MDAITALYRQVWEQPDDDHVRLVLADALELAGDPRAEIIQLQLRPVRDPSRRVMKLLQQHGLTWLGALRGHVVPIAYERGFLASCLAIDGDACAGADEWATVHTLELPRDAGIGFLAHPAMRSLRHLVGVTPRMWSQLPPLQRLDTLDMATVHVDQAVLETRRWPALRRVTGSHGMVGLERVDGDRFARLTGVSCPGLYAVIQSLAATPEALTELVLRDIPFGERDSVNAFARSQLRLARFELNGIAQPVRT